MPGPTGVAIAAPHHLAVAAAERTVAAGGTVVDAAVAAAVTLTVVYPHQCSLGGDLFALLRSPGGDVVEVNASGAYGSGPRPEGVVAVEGPLSVSVPGVVSGWEELLRLGGSLPLEVVVAPAVEAASEGFAVGDDLAEAMREAAATDDPGLRELVEQREVLRQPQVAGVLQDLARDGLASFYTGGTARRLVAAFERLGVPITKADLAGHRVRTGPPLSTRVGGRRIDTAHPNSQGYLLPRALQMAEQLDELTPADWVHIFRECGRARDEELADPNGRPGGDTVAVTAVATDGTAVSLIQSLFHSFGSGLRDPDTGIVLHNRAASFSADPASPNAIAPGRRPAHTLMPVLVAYDDGRVSAHGAMGGKAQPQIHAQLLQRLEEGLTPQEAVAAPRFVVGALGAGEEADVVLAERDLGAATLASLEEAGEVRLTRPRDSDVGHAMIASLGPDGALSAGADPRSDGATWVDVPQTLVANDKEV